MLTGMYIFNCSDKKNKKFSFGDKPLFYPVDFLASLEIKSIVDLKIYNDLILKYLERLPR